MWVRVHVYSITRVSTILYTKDHDSVATLCMNIVILDKQLTNQIPH